MDKVILIINAGSSSIKFAIFSVSENFEKIDKLYMGMVDKVLINPQMNIYDSAKKLVLTEKFNLSSYENVVNDVIETINKFLIKYELVGVGHRVVHGGTNYFSPALVDEQVINELTKLIPLAPLHEPYNLKLITSIRKIYPNLKQVACFDTSFHTTQGKLFKMFAIPRKLSDEGVIKYGFHGLSYEYISTVLSKHFPEQLANGKILIAHLGNGASACAISNKKSVASSMGFTALEGLMMGTRCGNIDPGVILYLLDHKKLTLQETTNFLYKESGLLGVSGISSDVRELELSNDPKAKEALELFCYRAARELLALCVALQGVDLIIFTAGIGEHSAFVRRTICEWLSWLEISIDEKANKENAIIISRENSKVKVAVIPTDEELMMVKHTIKFIS